MLLKEFDQSCFFLKIDFHVGLAVIDEFRLFVRERYFLAVRL